MRPSNHLISKAAWTIVIIMLGVMFSAQKLAAIEQSEKEMTKLVERHFELYNTGNLSIVDEICAPDFVRYNDGKKNPEIGIDAYKKYIAGHRERYPDVTAKIDKVIIKADIMVCQWTWTATESGPGSYPPTGKRITIQGVNIYKVVNSKIAEIWFYWNNHEALKQIGFTITPPTVIEEE